MKKKILFMVINMNVGGTEKALINMISEMPKNKYDITILMLEEYGEFLSSIPHEVQVEYLKDYKNIKDALNKPPQIVALNSLKEGKVIKAVSISIFHLISKIMKDRSIFYKYVLKNYPIIENEYDIAVAYAGPMDFISYYVVHKIKAKKKIQWVHFDITKVGFNHKFASKLYNKFDKIFVVSSEARDKLISVLPNLKNKTQVFLNMISPKMIYNQAKEGNGFNDRYDGIRILTVGRLTGEKGQDLAIRVLARLVKDGYKVKWYCVGEGNKRKEYERLVEEHNLENNFIFLGATTNPYSYIKQCDIYVQPSRHEGYCITLAEAKCLNKPIVTTDFAGAKEQIEHGKTGIIVGANENETYDAISHLLSSKDLCEKFTNNLKNKVVNNTSEIQKLYDCLK